MHKTFVAIAALAVAIAVAPLAAAKGGPPAKADRGPAENAAAQAHIAAAKGTATQADAPRPTPPSRQRLLPRRRIGERRLTASPRAEEKAQTTDIQILGLNDFHGNSEPPTGSGGRIGRRTLRSSTRRPHPHAARREPEHARSLRAT